MAVCSCPVSGDDDTDSRCPMHGDKARRVEDAITTVNHPAHYGGKDNPYEAIKVIEAWSLDFSLGNCIKYISRAGKKGMGTELEDLEKARWYLDRAIQRRKK